MKMPTNFIISQNITTPLEKAVSSLEKNKFKKLICGASNTNKKQIERLAIVSCLAGIDVIDISADIEVYSAALKGINRAMEIYESKTEEFPQFNESLIMLSVNAKNDPHFNKVKIDFTRCTNCFDCIAKCPANALYSENNQLKYYSDSCYGCGRCINICDAIEFTGFLQKPNIEKFNIKVLEIHTGNSSIDEVSSFLANYSNFINNIELISFSIESSLFSRNELIRYVDSLVKLVNKKVIIQVDGSPMSATNQPKSCLQSIAAANVLLNSEVNAYIQIAGGINHTTQKMLDLFNLKVAGIGYGTFLRKIILPYIEGFNETEFMDNLYKCVNITTNLVEMYGNSCGNSV